MSGIDVDFGRTEEMFESQDGEVESRREVESTLDLQSSFLNRVHSTRACHPAQHPSRH